ncbi:uncharacterized protein LOC128203768 [Mya arenaria]|uniref:uncharacterized protein LOC128203768 n=1 Tax=Mya arenaria TaxID=6604 RepID=UPI0022E37E14|nr:uncharacterized protein LOC128203768 [Mya arenaria]
MGPLFFLSLRKISIFGFRIDGDPHQLNFLIDENETMGKDGSKSHGPDAVISMIDWTLQNYGGQSTSCSIHADNCPGGEKCATKPRHEPGTPRYQDECSTD